MHDIHWKIQAINDLTKIGQQIANDSPTNAEKMIDLIEDKVEMLAAHPDIGRIGRKRGSRELVVHPSYIVIYRVATQQRVEVLRVKHTAQQWP